MKKVNLYLIKDELVNKATLALGHSLKYLCETGGRKKDGSNSPHSANYEYYNDYIVLVNKLAGKMMEKYPKYSPEEFLKALVQSDEYIEISEIVSEFLLMVSYYLYEKTGEEHTVTFIPAYFQNSFGNSIPKSKNEYGKYVRKLMRDMKISAKEIREVTISETYKENK